MAVAAVLVWGVAPPVLRSQLETRLGNALHRPVEVAAVRINPLQLAVTIDGLRVHEPDGAVWVRWDALRVNLNAWALVRGVWGFDAIELDGFQGRVAIDATGRINFADLLAAAEGTPAAGAPRPAAAAPVWPAVTVKQLTVRESRLEFTDASHARPFATTLGPISFSLTGFHTLGDPRAPYDFVARTESGESLRWHGQVSAQPLRSTGSIELAGLPLTKYAPYYRDRVAFDVLGGTLQLKVNYEADLSGDAPRFRLDDGEIAVAALALANRGNPAPAVTADALTLAGLSFDGPGRRLALGAVAWTGGQVAAVRTATGIDLASWLDAGGANPAGAATASTAAPAAGVAVRVAKVQLDGLTLRWRDETTPVPVVLECVPLAVQLTGLDLDRLSQRVALEVTATLASGGRLAVTGELGLVPFQPALHVQLSDLALAPLGAYAVQAAGYGLADGTVQLDGMLSSVGGSWMWQGQLGAAGVHVRNAAGEAVAGWEGLQLDGVSFAPAPLALQVASVRWVRPELFARLGPDGTFNWANPAPVPAAGTPSVAPAPAADGAPGPVVRIDRVELVQARVGWSDATLAKPAEVNLTDVSGAISGLSSLEMAKGRVDLRGKVNGVAPVAVRGEFNPLGRPASADVNIDFDRVDLLPVSGYVGKYAGYGLAGGRLTLDVDFALHDRSIQSATVATLDGFNLGAKVASPDATALPVGLAVKLLKDRNGQIVIDLPVAGDLDDPEFRIGRVVWRVITNLLSKAATAPFALLGAAFGGGDHQPLDHQEFAAGRAVLPAEATAGLAELARALQARPGLTLGLNPEFDPSADPDALRPAQLEDQLRAAAPASAFTATGAWQPGAREMALINRYVAVFGEPPIDQRALAAAGEPVAGPNPAAETPSRVESSSTGGSAPADATFLGWLHRLFVGNKATPASASESAETAPAATVLVGTTTMEVPADRAELPALPIADIEARLLAQMEIAPAAVPALAMARAAAVRDYLSANGVGAERLVIGTAAAGATQVRFDLR